MPTSSKQRVDRRLKAKLVAMKKKLHEGFSSNPHHSFRLTRRRDYVRPLSLPHPFLFLLNVTQTLWQYKRIFVPLMLTYIILFAALVGLTSQETYTQLTDSLTQAGGDDFNGVSGALAQSGLTLLAVMSNGLNAGFTESQQIFAALIALIAWLTTIWLLRNLMAGNKVTMRDGLYNAGAPLVATAIVGLIILIQLLPVAFAALGYAAASTSGLIANGGAAAMLFWIAASLLGILSLYWVSSSMFALVIVTLPGMYPLKALATSRQLLLGRRVKFLLRFVWMLLFILALWVVVMIPVILVDMWLKSIWPAIGWFPLVPIVILISSTYTVIWTSTYIYLLYRKVVDYDEA